MLMLHSDDKGLVIPPRVAPIQVVLLPIFKKAAVRAAICTQLETFSKALKVSACDIDIMHYKRMLILVLFVVINRPLEYA